jgi:CRISPR/Cas system-associated exonuclease Cas4 (RecB family)
MSFMKDTLAEARRIREITAPGASIVEAIYAGYMNEGDAFKQKTSFAPSGLFYGSGSCSKRWVLAFRGGVFESKVQPLNVASMRNGIASHERIQEAMRNASSAIRDVSIELPVTLKTPPISGYADGLLTYEGEQYVVEIKTTTHKNFEYRKSTLKVSDYHLGQILIYMHILDVPSGVIIYESKDTNELFAITVKMTDEYRDWVKEILKWCSEVWDMYQNGSLPKRSFRIDSKVCKSCPLEQVCEGADGDIAFRRLNTSPPR